MIRIVRLGSARARGEGPRIGTVRRPPRGVPKSQFATRDFYDAWLPELAPSEKLVKQGLAAESDREWAAFAKRYRGEMAEPEPARLLAMLALLSEAANFSVGCYCEDEHRCHRSVLRELLREQRQNRGIDPRGLAICIRSGHARRNQEAQPHAPAGNAGKRRPQTTIALGSGRRGGR